MSTSLRHAGTDAQWCEPRPFPSATSHRITRTAGARQSQAKATADIAREFAKAMKTVTVIEGLVMLYHAKNRHALDMWRWHRRVGARLGQPPRRKMSVAEAPSSPAQQPTVM